jgi:hypothetical protein
MRLSRNFFFLLPLVAHAHPAAVAGPHDVSLELFAELEEFARLVDIAYCIGSTGIHPPFKCASRCADFKGFELVDVSVPPALSRWR